MKEKSMNKYAEKYEINSLNISLRKFIKEFCLPIETYKTSIQPEIEIISDIACKNKLLLERVAHLESGVENL